MRTRQQWQQQTQQGPSPDEVLKVPAQYRDAEGSENPVKILLAAAAPYIKDTGVYAARLGECVQKLLAGQAVQYDAADARAKLANYNAGGVQARAQELQHDAGALAAFKRDQEVMLTKSATKDFEGAATTAADAAEQAVRASDQEIAAGRRNAAYASLEGPATADDLARVQLVERETRVAGLEALHDAVESSYAAGNLEKCRVMMLASEGWVVELLGSSPQTRSYRDRQGGTREARFDGTMSLENSLARKLLRMFAELRVELVDPGLQLATRIFAGNVVPSFRLTFGYASAWDLPRQKFDPVSAQSGQLPDAYERLADPWWVRNLPYGRSDELSPQVPPDATVRARRGGSGGPPGWAPLRRTDKGMVRVRLDNLVAPERLGMGG